MHRTRGCPLAACRKLPAAAFLSFLLLSLVLPAYSQADTVLVVETMPVPVVTQYSQHFLEAFNAYPESSAYRVQTIEALGDRERAVKLLTAARESPPALIVTFATLAAQAAVEVFGPESGVPVLFAVVSAPVAAGVVDHLGVPSGTNVAGLLYSVDRETELNTVVELLDSGSFPKPYTFGVLHSSYPSSVAEVESLLELSLSRADVKFVTSSVPYRSVPEGLEAMMSDVRTAAAELETQVDFWWEVIGPLAQRKEYSELLLEVSSRPIARGQTPESVANGSLVALLPNPESTGRELAALALSILQGADPGTLPVRAPSDYDLLLNLTTSLRLNIVPPPDLLEMAGEDVYR